MNEKIKAHVAQPFNVSPMGGAVPEPTPPPTVWVEMHPADSHRARLLTGSREPVALIFERAYADPDERLVGFLHREDMVHLVRFFDLGELE